MPPESPSSSEPPQRPASERAPYTAPRLQRWGSLAEVTRKTGSTPDMNQSMKMGLG